MASPFVRTLLVSRASCIARASGAFVIHQSSRNGSWSRNWEIREGLECGSGWSVIARGFSRDNRKLKGTPRGPFPIAAASRRTSGWSVIARGFSRDTRKLKRTPRGPFPIAAASRRTSALVVEEDIEDESELQEEQQEDGTQSEDDGKGKIGRNASKKQSARAREWGRELATLSPSQLRQACNWVHFMRMCTMRMDSLHEDIYDAVMLVKNLGTSQKVKHGRRRQYNYIGGLLRDVDPKMMESVLKAIKDGDVEGLVFVPSSQPDVEDAEFELEVEDGEAKMKEDGTLQQAETWRNGLVAGDRAVEDEVYSIYDVDFDRQELRKLVREVRKYELKSGITSGSEETEVGQEPLDAEISALGMKRARAESTLLYFLLKLVKERRDNVHDSATL